MTIPADAVLPCGCIIRCDIVDGVNTLIYIPCRETCVNYRNALGEAASKGLEPEFREGP